jgi:predicted esterase
MADRRFNSLQARRKPSFSGRAPLRHFALLLAAWMAVSSTVHGSTILLKDGRRLQGSIGKVAKLADNPLSNRSDEPATITLVDDNLKRTFVPTAQVLKIDEVDTGEVGERIAVRQIVARTGSKVNRVGPIIKISPFDEHGRRTLTMLTNKGPLDVIQGITLITPLFCKVEGLSTSKKTPLIMDQRLATSSIPRETLHAILSHAIDPKNFDQRLKIVRLFLQQERYLDAQKELEGVVADFPKKPELAAQVQALRQLHARSIVKEIEVRRRAGQHMLAYALLEKFPSQDVAGETLQQVSEMLEQYRGSQQSVGQTLETLKSHIAAVTDNSTRERCEGLLKEMSHELNINTLDRMASYLRLNSDASLSPEQKVSLAVSGWLLGSDQADTNIIISLSLAKVRDLVRTYLNEPVKIEREKLLEQLHGMEGSSPALVARLIANMRPSSESPEPSPGAPGYYKFSIPVGIENEPDVNYYVQLPPQYDPFVRYPTIVTLNGAGTSAEKQIDWWAGDRAENGNRLGQATRLGYIVVAVDWLKDGQKDYEFSAREHAAVLGSLRDACRRFSIDTDRVFISGHSIGGNAAWDLGLAHPDLWAGVIPIVATCEKYCMLYSNNANLVPLYLLCGELDGDKVVVNAPHLERYLNKGFDVTVVEYRGRGHEDFHDDIQNLFDWMNRRPPRNFFPKEFTVSTMRPWDNYFWWLEADKFPARGMVDPENWPPARGVRPVQITGKVLATNGLSISSAVGGVTVWLSPEAVDFERPMKISLNNSSITKSRRIEPDLSVLLEDVRTRGDRLHAFWAKVEH